VLRWILGFFAVWAEVTIERGRISEFAVRSILENASRIKEVCSPVRYPILPPAANFSRGSIVLWMIYIEFELRYEKPQRARELVLRAMRECPWSKGTSNAKISVLIADLAMLAFWIV